MMDLNFKEFILLWGMYGISIIAVLGLGYYCGWWACRKKHLEKMKAVREKIDEQWRLKEQAK